MPLSISPDGKFHYEITAALAAKPATNRQKKILRFFDVQFGAGITAGGAGWEINAIMADPQNGQLWAQYLFHTNDLSSDSDIPQPCDRNHLKTIAIPEGWSIDKAYQKFRAELAANILGTDESPFDVPQPAITFAGKSFLFTGDFGFGTREQCRAATQAAGGEAPDVKKVSAKIHYLVIGSGGSDRFKRGAYGNKIEAAVVSRRERGTPAIISEAHWSAQLIPPPAP